MLIASLNPYYRNEKVGRVHSYNPTTFERGFQAPFEFAVGQVAKVNTTEFAVGSRSAPFDISIHDGQTGQPLRKLSGGFTTGVERMEVAAPLSGESSARLIAGDSKLNVAVFECGRCELLKRLPNAPRETMSLLYVNEWDHAIHCGGSDDVYVYDLAQCDRVVRKYEGHGGGIKSLHADLSRSLLMSSSLSSKSVKFWSRKNSRECVATLSLSERCWMSTYAEDLSLLFAAGLSSTTNYQPHIEAWDVRKTSAALYSFVLPRGGGGVTVTGFVRVGPDVFATSSGRLFFWRSDGKVIREVSELHPESRFLPKESQKPEFTIDHFCTLGCPYDRPPPLPVEDESESDGSFHENDILKSTVPILAAAGRLPGVPLFRMDTGQQVGCFSTGTIESQDLILCTSGPDCPILAVATRREYEVPGSLYRHRSDDLVRFLRLSGGLKGEKAIIDGDIRHKKEFSDRIMALFELPSTSFREDLLLTASMDATARVWQRSAGKQVACLKHRIDADRFPRVVALGCVSWRKWIVTGCEDRVVQVWDFVTQSPIPDGEISDSEGKGTERFNDYVVVGDEDRHSVILKASGDEAIKAYDVDHAGGFDCVQSYSAKGRVHSLFLHPTRHNLFFSSRSPTGGAPATDLWDMRMPKTVLQSRPFYSTRTVSVGCGIAAGLISGVVKLWKVDTMKDVCVKHTDKPIEMRTREERFRGLACVVPFCGVPPLPLGDAVEGTIPEEEVKASTDPDLDDPDDYTFSSDDEPEDEGEGEVAGVREIARMPASTSKRVVLMENKKTEMTLREYVSLMKSRSIRRGGPDHQRQVRGILCQLLDQLSLLHCRGVAHNGLSVDTILVSEVDSQHLRLVPTVNLPEMCPREDDALGRNIVVEDLHSLGYVLLLLVSLPADDSKFLSDLWKMTEMREKIGKALDLTDLEPMEWEVSAGERLLTHHERSRPGTVDLLHELALVEEEDEAAKSAKKSGSGLHLGRLHKFGSGLLRKMAKTPSRKKTIQRELRWPGKRKAKMTSPRPAPSFDDFDTKVFTFTGSTWLQMLNLTFLDFDQFREDDRLEWLGGGHFGDVFRVTLQPVEAVLRNVPEKFAAKKLFRARVMEKLGEEAVLEEVRKLAMCRHPNVVRVLGHCVDSMVIAFELLHKSVSDTVEDGTFPTNSFGAMLFVFIRCCEGVAFLASQGLQHRDLKWENVMTTKSPTQAGWDVKVIDFGTAKVVSSVPLLTSTSSASLIVGTPKYMAPERLAKQGSTGNPSSVDRSALDVYSLGVMMYALITNDFMVEHTKQTSVPLYTPPDVDQVWGVDMMKEKDREWIVRLMKKCVACNPMKRPRLNEILRELRKHVAEEPEAMELLVQVDPVGSSAGCRPNKTQSPTFSGLLKRTGGKPGQAAVGEAAAKVRPESERKRTTGLKDGGNEVGSELRSF